MDSEQSMQLLFACTKALGLFKNELNKQYD